MSNLDLDIGSHSSGLKNPLYCPRKRYSQQRQVCICAVLPLGPVVVGRQPKKPGSILGSRIGRIGKAGKDGEEGWDY